MLGKSSNPVIEIFTGSFISRKRAGPVDVASSPTHHLEPTNKTQSPKGLKSFDLGGVGLGIVAALEKPGSANKALFGRSNPIPMKSHSNNSSRNGGDSDEIMETESFEEYTIVTCHGPNKSYTKVYANGVEGDDKIPFRIQRSAKSDHSSSVFHISPVRVGDSAEAPPPDFLSACSLCQKGLHGKDIYMYRGEKAYCSAECRQMQMGMDEPKEKCSSAVAVSPYANPQILTTGILAI